MVLDIKRKFKMGYHGRGDSYKVISSSEDEGYENQSVLDTRIIELLPELNARDRQCFSANIFGEVHPVPVSPITDDTDRPFWAEDELSSSESRQRLIDRKQKRRHTLSYRNNIAVQRSRSFIFQSSNSSSDSLPVKISSTACKEDRCDRSLKGHERFKITSNIAKKKSCTRDKLISCLSGNKSTKYSNFPMRKV